MDLKGDILPIANMSQSNQQQEKHFDRARQCLQQSLSWYSSTRRHWNYPPNVELKAAVRQDLQVLKSALDKIDEKVIKIAAFGLVSRGKSAVVNALVGKKIFDTGPIHGITQWPKSVRWLPPYSNLEVELTDTPGLDEIEGQGRAQMSRQVAYEADLILFVVAGDLTRTEYQAISQLRSMHKPLILVFNKIDLYPETDRKEIYRQLQELGSTSSIIDVLSPDEIVMVAAQPQPVSVRVEWPDGRVTNEWENPPPQIDELKQKIGKILSSEGRSILALSSLFQARDAEANIAKKTIELRQDLAEEIIWQYSKYKALAVAVNPIAILDIVGGAIADLLLIRSLARLYGLPITNYQATKLWRKILLSSGGLLLGEIGSTFLLGLGKSGAAIGGVFESPAALTTYASTAAIQGAIAGYGAYAVGKVAQKYLEMGCTWGSFGPSTVIQGILNEVEPNTIIYRLRQELGQQLI